MALKLDYGIKVHSAIDSLTRAATAGKTGKVAALSGFFKIEYSSSSAVVVWLPSLIEMF